MSLNELIQELESLNRLPETNTDRIRAREKALLYAMDAKAFAADGLLELARKAWARARREMENMP